MLNPFSFPAQLSVITKPIPTGPRAGLHPGSAPPPHKRRRLEEGSNDHSQAGLYSSTVSYCSLIHRYFIAQLPYARPSYPVKFPPTCSSSVRPAFSEEQLRRRLAAVQAEIRRLSAAQKELYWQLQALRQPKPVDPPPVPQVSFSLFPFYPF
jgi:hypothetical protein